MELQPGAVEYLWPPQARDGKPFSIRVELDCHQEVGEAIEEDNDVTVRFIVKESNHDRGKSQPDQARRS